MTVNHLNEEYPDEASRKVSLSLDGSGVDIFELGRRRRDDPTVLQNPARFQIIQAVSNIDQSIDDHLGVSASIGGIDSVAGI